MRIGSHRDEVKNVKKKKKKKEEEEEEETKK